MSELPEKELRFDIRKLVEDNGGAARVAKITGKNRTAPYRWMERGFISSRVLEKLKTANPKLDIDDYII